MSNLSCIYFQIY